jgi:hypothetical protein
MSAGEERAAQASYLNDPDIAADWLTTLVELPAGGTPQAFARFIASIWSDNLSMLSRNREAMSRHRPS